MGLRICTGILVALLLCLGAEAAFAEKTEYGVVFTALDRQGSGKYAELADGIQAMLVSRLGAHSNVRVREHSFTAKELAALRKGGPDELGKDLASSVHADFVAGGGLFELVSGLQIQLNIYPLADDGETLHCSVVVAEKKDLIAKLGELADDAAMKMAGGKDQGSTVKAGASKVETDGAGGFVTVHPEAAYKRKMYAGTILGAEMSGIAVRSRGEKKAKQLPYDTDSLAVADIDGDSQKDVALLSGSVLRLLKVEKTGFVEAGQFSLPAGLRCHSMNLADLNGDGAAEIYLSCTNGLSVSSLIVTWQKNVGFAVLGKDYRWYLRPVYRQDRGWKLYGQQKGSGRLELIKPGIYELALTGNGTLQQKERVALPSSVNLFDFSYAQLDGEGLPELVVIDRKQLMRVYSAAGELLWVSQKNYGGSKTYLGPSQGSAVNESDRNNFTVDEDSERELIFVPGRIIAADLNGDGKDEVMACETKIGSFNFLKRLRLYSDSVVAGLSWDGSQLVDVWRTGSSRGMISDFSFELSGKTEAVAGDKTDEEVVGQLYMADLPNSGSFMELLPGSAGTMLSGYELAFRHISAK